MSGSRHVGTAGWSIPRALAPRFETVGTQLQRYARVMSAVEINSSFYRSHARATYERWAASTPDDFRFSVKVPRLITHELRLCGTQKPLERFLDETDGLGHRRGPLLVQLPPSLAFECSVMRQFLATLRQRYAGWVVCEPRHASWFTPLATSLLIDHDVSRVAADPAILPDAQARQGRPDRMVQPGASMQGVYFRWHGSPRMYWSSYGSTQLAQLAESTRGYATSTPVWCIFDNTASGAALENALDLTARLSGLGLPIR